MTRARESGSAEVGSIPAPAGVPARGVMAEPHGVVCSESDGVLTVEFRWVSPIYVLSVVIAFMVIGGLAELLSGELFVIPVLAVVLLAGYAIIAGVRNTTTVQVDRERLRITHRPLPWGGMELDARDVVQLYCDKDMSSSGRSRTYELNAKMRDGSRITLVSRLPSADLPRFLEQRVEAWMGIPDEPVAGELPR